MTNKVRYWYKRVFTPAQKRHILAEVEEAKAKDKKLGTRGGVAAVCRKYRITTAHLTLWRKQYEAAVLASDPDWLTAVDDAAE